MSNRSRESAPRRVPTTQKPSGRARAQRAPSRAPWLLGGIVVAIAVVIALILVFGGGGGSSSATKLHHDTAQAVLGGPAGPEGIALETGTLLAPAPTGSTGQTIDGIQCDPNEQAVYHVHTHLTVYVNGVLRPIPPGIGIVQPVAAQSPNGAFYSASTCYYWLHVHAQDGIIHIESPTVESYQLGSFFDIWDQPLSTTRVATAGGAVTVFVDGVRYDGDPTRILLGNREDIQIDVGSPVVPPMRVDWSKSQL